MQKFVLISILNVLLWLNIGYNMKWEIQIKNPSHENFSQMIVMDFSIVRIWPYFHKSIEGAIWKKIQFFSLTRECFHKIYMGHY